MNIKHLGLTNFRNYSNLELDLPSHIAVLQGDNAQGKSNLLEAIYLLAIGKSPRVAADRELINWSALDDESQACRLSALVEKDGGSLRLEIALQSAGQRRRGEETRDGRVLKRVKINGVVRRAVDLVGQINVVMFTADDIDIVAGEPSLRRRYLDITNSQVDRHYLKQLQRYNRILWQRNNLLRLIASRQAKEEELSFWDRGLVETGAFLIARREQTIAMLDQLARPIHNELSAGKETLQIIYRGSVMPVDEQQGLTVDRVAPVFSGALQLKRASEIVQGMSLVGPHRDDIRFMANEVDLKTYGSRGQQRAAILSLKLAEVKFLLSQTGERPLLLLDDVLSELDPQRRHDLLRSIAGAEQVLITATDLDSFGADFLAGAELFKVAEGRIQHVSSR